LTALFIRGSVLAIGMRAQATVYRNCETALKGANIKKRQLSFPFALTACESRSPAPEEILKLETPMRREYSTGSG
jgi:hypothetical protein